MCPHWADGSVRLGRAPRKGNEMSIADELTKLNALRAQGVITDAEFEQRKRVLLGTTEAKGGSGKYAEWSEVPTKNKWWFQALLTIVVFPIGLLFVLFFKAYHKKKGAVAKVGVGFKLFFVVLVLAALTFLASIAPQSPDSGAGNSTTESPQATTEAPATPTPRAEPTMVACDSREARQALANAIENNASRNVATLRLLDLQDIQELSYDEGARTRRCTATFVLNAGRERSNFVLSPSSSRGQFLVEIMPY